VSGPEAFPSLLIKTHKAERVAKLAQIKTAINSHMNGDRLLERTRFRGLVDGIPLLTP
jgi:hypothetical protein